MALIIYSKSNSFDQHIEQAIDQPVTTRTTLSPVIADADTVYLVHANSFTRELKPWLEASLQKGAIIGVASDNPQLDELLTYTQLQVRGYFNSYMAAPNYDQLLRLLSAGQSWFPPALTTQVFELARSVIQQSPAENTLEKLTKREKEIALAVSKGKTNKGIASDCNISERTVKTHLTQIFKKLQVKDRVALVIYMNQYSTDANNHPSV